MYRFWGFKVVTSQIMDRNAQHILKHTSVPLIPINMSSGRLAVSFRLSFCWFKGARNAKWKQQEAS